MSWDQYAAAWAVGNGGYDLRRAPGPVRGWLRAGYTLARVLAAFRVGESGLALAGLGLALAVPAVAGRNIAGLAAAAVLVLLAALTSTAARGLGVLAAQDSPRSRIRARVCDRLSEAAWLAGFWVAGVPGVLVAGCGLATGLHEYLREQALAAGMSRVAVQAVGEHPARATAAAAAFAVAGLAATTGAPVASGVLTVAAAGWLVLAIAGLGQLVAAIRRSLP